MPRVHLARGGMRNLFWPQGDIPSWATIQRQKVDGTIDVTPAAGCIPDMPSSHTHFSTQTNKGHDHSVVTPSTLAKNQLSKEVDLDQRGAWPGKSPKGWTEALGPGVPHLA